jgi:sensor histidine kinase YesM
LITSNAGLFLYRNNKLFNINTANGLLDNQIEGLHIQNDSTVWLESYKGVNKLLFQNGLLTKTERFTTLSGLPSNEVTSLNSDSCNIWIGTKEGICKINLNYKLSDEQLNPNYFLIDSILSNNDNSYNSDTINISHDSKLSIFFKYISYKEDKHIKFEYQIDSSEWILTNPNSLSIQNEKPGIHKLSVRSKDYGNVIFKYTIIISPHFSELIWFRILTILGFLIVIILIFKLYLNFKDQQKEAELDKLNLELKLLTSQMNPHFTFNSINSIQHYILKNKKHEAIKYLSDFALLIRKTLDFSFNGSITLEEEINFLNLYLNLENKRFENNFIIDLSIHQKIDSKTTKIPSFLLQPLIENVILHAKHSEDQEKKITLSINDFVDYLIIKIIDYGIGNSKKATLNKHKSYGLDIIRNRLKVYNGKSYKPNDLFFAPTNTRNTIRKYNSN